MKASGIGRFVSKPVLRKTTAGSSVSNFRLVFEERRKSKDGALVKNSHFFDFEIWDKAAELVASNFDTGDTIHIIQSTPREDKWEDKETGGKRSRVLFRIDEFGFVPRPTKAADERFRAKYASSEVNTVDAVEVTDSSEILTSLY